MGCKIAVDYKTGVMTLVNPNIQANAGQNQSVSVGTTVTLDGTRSTGQNLSFWWDLISSPSGSGQNISSQNTARPQYYVDRAGEYVFRLTASNTEGSSQATVKVTATQSGGDFQVYINFEGSSQPIIKTFGGFTGVSSENQPGKPYAIGPLTPPAGATYLFVNAMNSSNWWMARSNNQIDWWNLTTVVRDGAGNVILTLYQNEGYWMTDSKYGGMLMYNVYVDKPIVQLEKINCSPALRKFILTPVFLKERRTK
jgi:hypothetical protein